MWLAYAKAGKELEVIDALDELGITAHCAKVVEVKRVGKRHRPDVFIDPLLPNYIFVECDAEQYLSVVGVKHLAPTMTAIPTGDERSVHSFLNAAKNEVTSRLAKIEAGERLEQFNPGDVLEILSGRLSGIMATFRGIVEKAGNPHPQVSVSVGQMMGKDMLVSLDALHVKKAS